MTNRLEFRYFEKLKLIFQTYKVLVRKITSFNYLAKTLVTFFQNDGQFFSRFVIKQYLMQCNLISIIDYAFQK